MPSDYRYDPFNNIAEPVPITGETHIIPSNSPYTIRLKEVPVKDSPSTVSLTIAGVSAVEVAAEPAAGQFRCDYTTSADSDDNWNTGLIQFNAADAGKTVVAAYNGMGSLVSAAYHGFQLFTASGTFTVPKGVDKVYLTGCGGGGAGYGGTTPTVTAGGATSFGSLLTLSGGGAGTATAQGASGGFGGQKGWKIAQYYQSGGLDDNYYYNGGGDSLFGTGGRSYSQPATGYGAGGGTNSNSVLAGDYGGGGGAQCTTMKQAISVIPGQTYTVTIGAGGTNNKISALNGTAGFLLVEWQGVI